MNLTLESLSELLTERFGGVLKAGVHQANSECCVRELRACALGLAWTDQPDGGSPTDIATQRLNDAGWSSDAARTRACLPLALLSEADAHPLWTRRYVIATVQQIVGDLPGLPESVRGQCREITDIPGAHAAALASLAALLAAPAAAANAAANANDAANYAANDADDAANYAAVAANHAAAAAAAVGAARDNILERGVRILLGAHRGDACTEAARALLEHPQKVPAGT